MADAAAPALGAQQAAPAAAHAPNANSREGRLALNGFKASLHMDDNAHPEGEPRVVGAQNALTGAHISTVTEYVCPVRCVCGCLRCQVDTVVDHDVSTRRLREDEEPAKGAAASNGATSNCLSAHCEVRTLRGTGSAPLKWCTM